MEPGHEDREYNPMRRSFPSTTNASMEPGHEDREYLSPRCIFAARYPRLNGARS